MTRGFRAMIQNMTKFAILLLVSVAFVESQYIYPDSQVPQSES